jgi:hypothetical protein
MLLFLNFAPVNCAECNLNLNHYSPRDASVFMSVEPGLSRYCLRALENKVLARTLGLREEQR